MLPKVALSLSDWGGTLDLTVVPHLQEMGISPLEDQIVANGELVRDGLASVEGLGTVDILFGTYYTVSLLCTSHAASFRGLTHVTFLFERTNASRTAKERSLGGGASGLVWLYTSTVMPVTLMNLQMNSLTHQLYGAGADLTDQYAYYHLCTAANLTQTVGGVTTIQIFVSCNLAELGGLPSEVNYMYLQSAAIDHQYNYAWFTFKEEPTGAPRILEYQHDSHDYVLWPQDSLPDNAVFSSLIQTAPRIIFALYPPALQYARFNAAGTKLFVSFDTATLRGAVPVDTNGDDIPDFFNEADKATRGPCDDFIDRFTMILIPGSTCQWTTDADFYIEIQPASTIAPGDLARIKPGTVYRGQQLPSGVYQFSQPSSDFAVVEAPLEIPTPRAEVGGLAYIDVCTELVLDGTQSSGHGFRGAFTWALSSTTPQKPEPHIRQLQNVLESAMAAEAPVAAQVIRIPAYLMQGDTLYNFSLTVQSFWNPALSDTIYYSVTVSPLPVPPMAGDIWLVFTAAEGAQVEWVEKGFAILRLNDVFWFEGGEFAESGVGDLPGRARHLQYIRSKAAYWAAPRPAPGLPAFLTRGKCLRVVCMCHFKVKPFALEPLETYIFTISGEVNVSNGTADLTLQNVVSAEVEVVLGDLLINYYGGTGFSSRRDRAIVVDFTESLDYSDPAAGLLTLPHCAGDCARVGTYTYSCQKEGTQNPCFASQGSSTQLFADACVDVEDPLSPGQSMKFTYRDKDYNQADGISLPPYSNVVQHCKSAPTTFIFQPNLFATGNYVFVVNASKVVMGAERVDSGSLYITVQADTEVDPERTPLVAVFLESPQPIFAGSTLRLRGEITNPQNDTTYSFQWTAYRYGLNPDYDAEAGSFDPLYAIPQYSWVELSPVDFNASDLSQVRTPPDSRFLVVSPNVLIAGLRYRMRISVLDAYMFSQGIEDYLGFAEYTFVCAGLPPSGGELIVSNISGTALQTEFVFTMDGFGSEDLPLTYRFSYIQNYEMPFAEAVELNIAFTEQNFIKTRLPEGLVGSQNLLRVIGTVRSSRGATAQAMVDVSVSPPGQQAITDIVEQVPLVDPETAVFFTTLLADTEAASDADVSNALQVTYDKMFGSARAIAATPEMVSTVSDMLTSVIDKGITTDQVVDFVGTMVNMSVDLGYIAADASLGSTDLVDVALGLLYALDAIIPGVVPSYEEAAARRLKGGRGMGGKVPGQWTPRRLQTETRDFETMYQHFLVATAMMKQLTDVVHLQLYPGEVPVSFALPGQDIFMGKDFSDADEVAQNYARVTTLFDLPSLERSGLPSTFNYRYVQFKKFPYDFLVMPGNRSLEAPAPANESRPEVQSLVPPQTFNASQRPWHAMSLIITDEAGESNLLERSIENASFSMLPKIAAYDGTSLANVENPSTCYWVDLGSGNFSEALFDARGSLFSEDSCITMHMENFVVLADDLAAELDVVQQESPGELLSQYEDDYTTTANVVTATLVLVACAGFVMVSVYVDEHDAANKVTPLDSLRTQVIDREDPKEKVLGTIFQSMRRNHLVIGWNYFHLKLTRVRRAGIFVVAIFATEALAVLQHSLLAFKVDSAWGASGLVAAVLVFPLVQFLEFCFEWLPQSRVLSRPPPRSAPAKPIPLKEQAQPKVCKYPKRPAVGKVRPPQPKALPRVEQSLQLPAGALEQTRRHEETPGH
ncbi:cysS [Symbiodinium natans]|uniref:CysS protein n=1 Tax=Symbiodinium natans TaxID=878477 RepID=A0A812I7U0_9DINO|nr:cysS [Symbiodinium natans]